MLEKTMKKEIRNIKFKKLANTKIKRVMLELTKMIEITENNRYEIFDTDAKKILNVINPVLTDFIERYTQIANNEFYETKKLTIENIF